MEEELKISQDNSVFAQDDSIYNQPIKAVPPKSRDIGIDTDNTLYDNIILTGDKQVSTHVDIGEVEKFTSISSRRNQVYNLLDSMCEDSKVSAVIESYSEDITDYNDKGQIVWCEASDANIQSYVTYLLDSLNVDKHIFDWASSLCKYGDIYIRLYRESDHTKLKKSAKLSDSKYGKKIKLNEDALKEDIKIKAYGKGDHYVNYVELWSNPAEVFELDHMGKTYAYIQADVINETATSDAVYGNSVLSQFYKFNKNDVTIYSATDFVHAALNTSNSRYPERIQLFTGTGEDASKNETFKVVRGKSLLYDVYKTWRNLTLLENSLLLNRLTKSAILRVIMVDVGDMPKESVAQHLLGIKNMIEQKTSISAGKSLSEYTNPGPIENNIYVPKHGEVGNISTMEIGGNPDVKSIVDIDYYLNQFYGGLRVPKQFFNQTDDSTGFNGGTSLTIISARYAKMVKRIQNTLCQMISDIVNLFLVDRGLLSYINNFTIRMQPPATAEEKDRRDQMSAKVRLIQDTMNMLNDVEDKATKLSILKAMLSTVITDTEVIQLLQDYIDKISKPETEETKIEEENSNRTRDFSDLDLTMPNTEEDLSEIENEIESEETIENGESSEMVLPNPSDLGIDFTVNQ